MDVPPTEQKFEIDTLIEWTQDYMQAFALKLVLASAAFSARPLCRTSPPLAATPTMLLGMGGRKPDVPRTVGDAKDAFQKAYGKPVGALAQSFVSEMLTSCTLATASPLYKYTRVFAVGFETLCESFFVAIPNDKQRAEIHDSMCVALELDTRKLVKDAADLKAEAAGKTEEELLALPDFREIAEGHKYSYPFGAGLLTLMPLVGSPPTAEVIQRWCGSLSLASIRLEKDWLFFEKALENMANGRQMMLEMQASAKRKEAAALKAKADKAAADAAAEEGGAAAVPAEAEEAA